MTTEEGFICCLCGEKSFGWGDKLQWGNNPEPISEAGECCNECNNTKVIPERIRRMEDGH